MATITQIFPNCTDITDVEEFNEKQKKKYKSLSFNEGTGAEGFLTNEVQDYNKITKADWDKRFQF